MVVIASFLLPLLFLAGLGLHLGSAISARGARRAARKQEQLERERVEAYVQSPAGALEAALTRMLALPKSQAVRARVGVGALEHLKKGKRGESGATINFPHDWPGHEGDRDRTLALTRSKLGNTMISLRWDLVGAQAHAKLYIPALPPAYVAFDEGMANFSSAVPFLGYSADKDEDEYED